MAFVNLQGCHNIDFHKTKEFTIPIITIENMLSVKFIFKSLCFLFLGKRITLKYEWFKVERVSYKKKVKRQHDELIKDPQGLPSVLDLFT